MVKVLIVQRVLPHYRVEFFSRLQHCLSLQGIEMELIYGQHDEGTVPASSKINEPWAKFVANKYYDIFGVEAVTQNIKINALKSADLIIVEQASRLLVNYRVLLFRYIYKYKVAFWGHGKNYQAKKTNGFLERVKKFQTQFADYWFAYTSRTKEFLESVGVPSTSITVVNNSVDAQPLITGLQALNSADLASLRHDLQIESEQVAIFCGGMDERKRIPFLLDAIVGIKALLPDFTMIFVGDGPYANLVSEFCNKNPWAHYVGKITSDERSKYFAVSSVMLMPGALGLVIIDSLVTGTPIVSTKLDSHNPEVVYLEHDQNSIFVNNHLSDYISAVSEIFYDPHKIKRLQTQCEADAKKFSLDAMVDNFAKGVVAVIGSRD